MGTPAESVIRNKTASDNTRPRRPVSVVCSCVTADGISDVTAYHHGTRTTVPEVRLLNVIVPSHPPEDRPVASNETATPAVLPLLRGSVSPVASVGTRVQVGDSAETEY